MVSCDRQGLLQANLPTLLEQTTPFARVLVVDNGSTDGSRAWLATLPGVEVVALESNRGFAAGLNRGIEIALARPDIDWIATINNDVRLDPEWHSAALAAVRDPPPERLRRPVGSVATLLLQDGNPGLVDSAGITWKPSGHDSENDSRPRSGRALNRLHGTRVADLEPGSGGNVWGASAAAALYSRALLDAVGGFDESFFAYQEDVDLAVRARLAGYVCRMANRAIGWHLGHGSNRRFPLGGTRADYLNSRNRLAVMVSARLEGYPLSPLLRRVTVDLLRSIPERRAPAIWLGTVHGLLRLPRSLMVRRALHHGPESIRSEACPDFWDEQAR